MSSQVGLALGGVDPSPCQVGSGPGQAKSVQAKVKAKSSEPSQVGVSQHLSKMWPTHAQSSWARLK